MAPGGEMVRYPQHFGENVLRYGSHEWLPYSKNEVRLKSSNTNLSFLPTTQGGLCLKKRARKRFLSKYDGKKYGWFLMCRDFVLMLAGVSLLFSLLVGVSRVDGTSMDPTLRDGQVVFFTRVNLRYRRGDVVYARMPSGKNYVKRVIALENDVVDLRDGRLYVNGLPEDNPHARGTTLPQTGIVEYPYTVGEDMVFLVGDNREGSVDSRSFGALPTGSIRGKLIRTGG